MSPDASEILSQVLNLPPMQRAELVERILDSFSLPDREAIDRCWAAEVEDRIDSYDRGDLTAKPARDVFGRIDQHRA